MRLHVQTGKRNRTKINQCVDFGGGGQEVRDRETERKRKFDEVVNAMHSLQCRSKCMYMR